MRQQTTRLLLLKNNRCVNIIRQLDTIQRIAVSKEMKVIKKSNDLTKIKYRQWQN